MKTDRQKELSCRVLCLCLTHLLAGCEVELPQATLHHDHAGWELAVAVHLLSYSSSELSFYTIMSRKESSFSPCPSKVARDHQESSSAAAVEKGQLLLRALAAAPCWTRWVKSLDLKVLVRIIVPSISCLAAVVINS